MNLDRASPQNINAERAVLGAMLLPDESKVVISKVSPLLNEVDFYKESHRKIYAAILDVFETSEPVDLLTVVQKLEARGDMERVGGVTYLDEMIDAVPTGKNAEYYAEMIKQEAMRRQLIQTTSQAYNDAFSSEFEFDDLISRIETSIMSIRRNTTNERLVSIRSVLKPTFEHVQKLYDNEETVIGLPTGFKDIDDMLSGLQNGEYIIVAGRPSMGKSTYVQNIVQHVSIKNRVPAVIFTPEMSAMSLTLRFLSSEARVPIHDVRKGMLDENDWPSLTIAAGRISESPIMIDDTADIKLSEIRAKCHQMKAQHDIGLVVVDYLQLVRSDRRFDSENREISEISNGLKAIGRTLDVPMIVCSQLNRSCEARADKRPMLSDLRASGSIEQDADVVLCLYRDRYYNKDSDETTTEVIVRKQRNGPTGTVKLFFEPRGMRFRDVGGSYQDEISF